MRAGALQHIIDIQADTGTTVTDLNEPIESWTTIAEGIYAEVKSLRGKEQFNEETGQRFSETVYHFRVRFEEVNGVLTAKMRIAWEGRLFDVRHFLADYVKRSDVLIEATEIGGAV